MTAIRIIESTGSLGTLQVADGYGGFATGTLLAGMNVTISDNGLGSFTLSSFYPEPSGILGSLQVADGQGGYTTGSIIGGNNIDVTSDGSGSFTISQASTGSVVVSGSIAGVIGLARNRASLIVTGNIPAQTHVTIPAIDFSEGGFEQDNIDVFVNGQLLYTGSGADVGTAKADYTLQAKDKLSFAFELLPDDIITTTVITTGSGDGTAPSSASYIVYEGVDALPNARVLEFGSGIQTDLSEPGKFKVSTSREKRSYLVTGSHPLGQELVLDSVDFSQGGYENNRIDVFVNGQLMISGTNADYILDGSSSGLIFSFDLFDGDQVGTIIM